MNSRSVFGFAGAMALQGSIACGAPSQDLESEDSNFASRTPLGDKPLWLETAQAVYTSGAMTYPAWLKGTIGVTNFAYDKQVWVMYQVTTPQRVVQDWARVDARWASGDLWEFQTPKIMGECPHYCSEISFRFYVNYQAAGKTYVDNNNGWNYGVTVDLSPVPGGTETPPGFFARAPLQLSQASWTSSNNQWRGEILLKNIGGMGKSVALVYTTDGWKTVQEAPAAFGFPSHWTEFEHWRFNVTLPGSANDLAYAIRYNTGSQVYWDNNLTRNYSMRKE